MVWEDSAVERIIVSLSFIVWDLIPMRYAYSSSNANVIELELPQSHASSATLSCLLFVQMREAFGYFPSLSWYSILISAFCINWLESYR
ncbi:hypothetical protein HI914_07456 [Erysiphe necator]|nr:hypothetical protein HI914_07456 [Erysiphe necator]